MAEDNSTQKHDEPTTPTATPSNQSTQIQEQQQNENASTQFLADSPAPPLTNIHADIDMGDTMPSMIAPSSAATPTGQRTATPMRNTNGHVEAPPPLPAKAAIHGAPARRYLNEKVTGVLLEGMKRLAVEQYEEASRSVAQVRC
ncbi:MAG: hypothetical protein Q9219_000227 [cf. Caloplaca sp. 3 TL-2023]